MFGISLSGTVLSIVICEWSVGFFGLLWISLWMQWGCWNSMWTFPSSFFYCMTQSVGHNTLNFSENADHVKTGKSLNSRVQVHCEWKVSECAVKAHVYSAPSSHLRKMCTRHSPPQTCSQLCALSRGTNFSAEVCLQHCMLHSCYDCLQCWKCFLWWCICL